MPALNYKQLYSNMVATVHTRVLLQNFYSTVAYPGNNYQQRSAAGSLIRTYRPAISHRLELLCFCVLRPLKGSEHLGHVRQARNRIDISFARHHVFTSRFMNKSIHSNEAFLDMAVICPTFSQSDFLCTNLMRTG
jgi:hypothetical protein